MIQTLEQAQKRESKRLKVPAKIRPFRIGYQVVDKFGSPFALKNGATIFDLPSLAKKAIQKEFGKDNPSFDVEKYAIEEVAIVNFSKLQRLLEEVE